LLDLDKRIAAESAKLGVLQGKISTLEIRLERERDEQQRKDYSAQVDKLEAALPALEAPAKQVASAFKTFADAIEKLDDAQSAFRKAHPPGFLLPANSLTRAERAVAAAFDHFSRRGADRLQNIREVSQNFLRAELDDYRQHIETLRAEPNPTLIGEASGNQIVALWKRRRKYRSRCGEGSCV
jgi:DNA repair exonuclease SbcCD ATPase subunit